MRKGLLLGAGFSFDLGMPLAAELTDDFFGVFTQRNARELASVLSNNEPYGADRPINSQAIHEGMELLLEYKGVSGGNYEDFLSKLENLGNSGNKTQSDCDSYHYLFGIYYELICLILTRYQLFSYEDMYWRNLENFSQLKNLLNSTEETWVFTLNHDLYFECLAIDLGIPVTYGDYSEITFPLSNIEPDPVRLTYCPLEDFKIDGPGWIRNKPGVNLVRLHGGLCELDYQDHSKICNPSLEQTNSAALIAEFKRIERMGYYASGQRVPSGRYRVITGPDGALDIICRTILTGGHKYSKTTNPKKGEEKLQLFADALSSIDELTIIGYGFGDRHVNHRISNAMVMNDKLKVRIVDPVGPRCPESLEQFDYGGRVRGGVCGAPHWISFVKDQQWDSKQLERLRMNEAFRCHVRKKVISGLPR